MLEKTSETIYKLMPLFYKHLFRMDQGKIKKGLGKGHMEILDALDFIEKEGDQVSLTELANRLLVSKAYISALTYTLFREKLVDMVPDSNDRRKTILSLTEKGRKTQSSFKGFTIGVYKKRLSSLSTSDLTKLISALNDLKDVITKIKV